MKTFNVSLPISGFIVVSVEAESVEDAITKALASDYSGTDIEEWQAHRQIVQGNIFHGVLNEAEADEE